MTTGIRSATGSLKNTAFVWSRVRLRLRFNSRCPRRAGPFSRIRPFHNCGFSIICNREIPRRLPVSFRLLRPPFGTPNDTVESVLSMFDCLGLSSGPSYTVPLKIVARKRCCCRFNAPRSLTPTRGVALNGFLSPTPAVAPRRKRNRRRIKNRPDAVRFVPVRITLD